MPDIRVLVACLSHGLAPTPLRPLGRVIEAMRAMRGRVTIRGLSRWSGQGGSSRPLPRFCTPSLNGGPLPWLLMRQQVLDAAEVVVLSGDYGVVPKAGTMPSGFDRFCASLYGKAVPGLCLLSLSLLSVKRRTSDPVVTAQVEQASAAAAPAQPTKTTRGARGRPTGSKNRHRREVERSPSLPFLPDHSKRLRQQLGEACKVVYVRHYRE